MSDSAGISIAPKMPGSPSTRMLPVNLDIMKLDKTQLQSIRQVSVLDIFDGRGGNFHDDGLFSTTTFGRVGDPVRDRRFGYIDLKVSVLHPTIYKTIIKLNKLYEGILTGREFAIFDKEQNDFIPASAIDGDTGYAFFVAHFKELIPKRTGSSVRDVRVDKVLKYKDKALVSNWLVLPAGLREADIETDGRVSMDEINEMYQGILMQTRNIPDNLERGSMEEIQVYDRTRYSITLKIIQIYDYIENLLSGKNGFIQSRWASRRIFNSTRNVLSSLDTGVADLSAPNRPGFRDVVIGLNQATKNVLPKSIFYLRTSIVNEIFDTASNRVELVDPTSLRSTFVEISSNEMDTWTTIEGLERVINDLGVLEKRDRPVMVGDHYLALIYVDDKQNYKIIRSIDEVPEEFDRSFVRPITLMELIYLSGVDHWNTFPCFVTRYPVENMYSSVPCKQYVKTTEKGELRYRLDRDWKREPLEGRALEFPVYHTNGPSKYHDSTAVPVTILAPLGAD
tara:strand:- start:3729 stop:5252 length:1524 start_codon:yes stop_codon:yes gene_type:complete